MKQIITDTSGLYALVDRKDRHHPQAAEFLRTATKSSKLLVSNHVFDETMTLSKVRLGTPVALQLGLRLRNSRLIEFTLFSLEQEMETWRIFSRYQDKAWSYTDCASLALARQLDLHEAFAFDHHFAQMGLRLIP